MSGPTPARLPARPRVSSGRGSPGCPLAQARDRLRRAGLKPTAQRCAIAWLITASPPRHLTPETLYGEALAARVSVSMSSIYNIVRQFAEKGLLRERVLTGGFTVFDTDVSDHHHFVVEATGEVLNVPWTEVPVADLPSPPDGYEVAAVELVVRLRKPRSDA